MSYTPVGGRILGVALSAFVVLTRVYKRGGLGDPCLTNPPDN